MIREIFPYLRTSDGASAIDFYQRAFGAEEIFRLSDPSGRIAHAELSFGDRVIMVSDAFPEYGIHAPQPDAPAGSSVHLHVADVDEMTARAAEAGAEITMEPADQFYGERASRLRDPFGHEWLLGQQIEDLDHDEIQRRFAAMFEAE